MKQKLLKIVSIASVVTALSIPGSVYANSKEDKAIEENLKIITSYSPEITYEKAPKTGTINAPSAPSGSNENEVSPSSLAFINVASGTTDTDYISSIKHVMTSGSTKGKKISVTTSATASIWFEGNFSAGLLNTGPKNTAIAYGTASSTTGSTTLVDNTVVSGSYRGITYHSCVYDFTLYELKTSESVTVY
ncbi:hypothetical protein [Paenibacillus lutrae]|uniref:Uncharacterized protein n=1 Tax=Paenibacillus lutrae TaxID=2078573 RepID=A0A7X3K0R0_9BACL|nr:hypothetical protein [Paenibacillus lutrae]MVP01345.1 hypothetical protein [Paenibacillus lutrae]